ncbi:MAG: energy transducer TonB [Pseudotabrizicola sp.]|uniref:energy transducer TonB family protein n=1 Tax=Pseudotabrizicola sp. TaxID=2939647 RepID=UPI00271AC5C4|nr:energy transducer TonB [Pseudotabrizicola sp.]MDO9637836.1 energy transducer TonB [Pseudotabrizicola sp.]
MSARLHAGLAIAIALGLHVAVFAIRTPQAGAMSAGAGGTDLVSLQAADAVLAELITEWDRPPTPEAEPVAELTPPVQPETPPPLTPVTEPPPPLMPAPDAMALPPMAEVPLNADISLPPPPPPEPEPLPEPEPDPVPEPEPEPEQRPKPRPADLARPNPPEAPKAAAKPAPQTPSAGQAAQRAAGSGGGAQAGDSGSAQAATRSAAQQNDLKAGWGASIRSRIERRKAYPAAARGAAGTVTVRLTVSRSGQLAGVAIAKSSGNAALDQAAVRAVQSARYPAAPAGLTDASYSFTLPMTFQR